MTGADQAAREYLHAVRQLLDAPQADQDRLMKWLTQAVSTYMEENEAVHLDALVAEFGQPEACAAGLLAELDPTSVAVARKRRKQRLHAIIGILAVLVVLLSCFAIYFYSKGGIVTIEHTHYSDGESPFLPPEEGTTTVTYEYEE